MYVYRRVAYANMDVTGVFQGGRVSQGHSELAQLPKAVVAHRLGSVRFTGRV